MTVSTEVDHNEYTGNGVTTTFPYTFRIFKKSDLVVQVVDLNDNITVLTLDTDYTVTGAGGYVGGNVILATALANGYQISISRELPVTQETDLRNQGKFFAEVHEDALDKLTMLIQQVRSWFSLALRKPSFAANYYDAMDNYIRNLRAPSRPKDAATKDYVDILSGASLSRSLRVPESFINELPDADGRKNKTLSFDNSGSPLLLDPESSGLWGYSLIDSFQDGASITTRFQALHWKRPDGNGEYYRWDGSLPKDVPENSTPESTGGVSLGAWVSVGDASLRSDLISQETDKGSSIVTYTPKFNDAVSMSVYEKLSVDLVTLSDYGFKVGNTGAKNKAAFQKAIDDATLPTEIVIPEGVFIVDPGITIKNTVTMIRGAGAYQSRIFSTGTAAPIITQQDGVITFCEFRDFGLDGNGYAANGISLTEANHIKIENIDVVNTNNNAILVNGYSIDIIGCRLFQNTGNGINVGGHCNNINIINNRIYGNGAGGVLLTPAYAEGGMSVRVNGNDIEQNKFYGLLAYGVKGLNLDANYWERNGEIGYPYSVPESITVRADIHLIANNFTLIPDLSKINDTVSIRGNQQTAIGYASALPNQDGFIFTNYAKNLTIENNQLLDASKVNNLLAMYHNNLSSKVTDRIYLANNTVNSIGYVGSYDPATQNPDTAHLIDIANRELTANYLDRNMLLWTAASGTTGTLIKTQNIYAGNYSFLVTTGDRVWGRTIDLNKSPELKGKFVWFGAWVNDQGTASKLMFIVNGAGQTDSTAPLAGNGKWRYVSCGVYIYETDTAINVGIRNYGSGNVLINSPSLCVYGMPSNALQVEKTTFYLSSVPTSGFWDIGERVINSAPASGQPKAWTCNIPGGPGIYSFLSEGNY
ncbi:right-handed parallel beta-helix repeat-containing protein [Escherichia coli]|uniref:tail fiber/spike domain-containing protein n=1 Tax=Escherichia coli TaxID=562 RepID=UPI00169082CF|nr:phage tail protein [Escherichia coli]EET5724912.1 phage tail protein [Escherichia coli]EET6550839.1 phage tail protein [Escherichia coli]EFE4572129.1 phage tail protein [Escherichia coli]EFJ0400957.1 phage tail protein [Escherichia coli]